MSTTIDMQFQGRAGVIATAVVPVGGGVVLVDPGPSSCLAALERGLAVLSHTLEDVRGVLLTHIHLDHAGAAGTIARRVPGVPIYVHERGAIHLASPDKLLASATRLYGAAMDQLWGEFLAVPATSLRALGGGETVTLDGRRFAVAYTPGHAVHHVSYLDTSDGTAYVGDTAGIRTSPGYVLPATPPPDIDLEAWEASLLAAGYRFRLDDTLNRFYVAEECPQVFERLPAVRGDWAAVTHMYEIGKAPDNAAHPDHGLARDLIAGLMASLPLLEPELVGQLLSRARGLARDSAEAQALLQSLEEEGMRLALGRIACGFDGGQIG